MKTTNTRIAWMTDLHLDRATNGEAASIGVWSPLNKSWFPLHHAKDFPDFRKASLQRSAPVFCSAKPGLEKISSRSPATSSASCSGASSRSQRSFLPYRCRSGVRRSRISVELCRRKPLAGPSDLSGVRVVNDAAKSFTIDPDFQAGDPMERPSAHPLLVVAAHEEVSAAPVGQTSIDFGSGFHGLQCFCLG